ncbi:MAG: hypothetical protein R3E18_07025 [Sphingomonadaceae bacterium]|nr:hypothetical protein [Sphingomonadaceae bacterium]
MAELAFNLLQLGGSLLAILALAALARWMKLGAEPRIRDAESARMLAEEVDCGFEPVDIALDRFGYGALLRDASGRVMLIRQHGANFVGRMLDSRVQGRLDQGRLVIALPEASFGTATLDLGPAAAEWAASFRRLPDQAGRTYA